MCESDSLNAFGALSLAVAGRIQEEMASVAGHGASGPAALGRARRRGRRRLDRHAAPDRRHHALGARPAGRPPHRPSGSSSAAWGRRAGRHRSSRRRADAGAVGADGGPRRRRQRPTPRLGAAATDVDGVYRRQRPAAVVRAVADDVGASRGSRPRPVPSRRCLAGSPGRARRPSRATLERVLAPLTTAQRRQLEPLVAHDRRAGRRPDLPGTLRPRPLRDVSHTIRLDSSLSQRARSRPMALIISSVSSSLLPGP
jgi:hypothetical protein